MVDSSNDTEIIMTYLLFMGIMLFLTPYFAPDLFNVTQDDIAIDLSGTGFEPFTAFITRVSVLFSITVSLTWYGNIIALFVIPYTVGAFFIVARIVIAGVAAIIPG